MSEEGRPMYEVGVDGEFFHVHAERPGCQESGCVPLETITEKFEKDAARYRWLRAVLTSQGCGASCLFSKSPTALDATIDAEMAEEHPCADVQ